jgi:hypothetical protein
MESVVPKDVVAKVKQWNYRSSMNSGDGSNGTGVEAVGAGTGARAAGAAVAAAAEVRKCNRCPTYSRIQFDSACCLSIVTTSIALVVSSEELLKQALISALRLQNTKCCYVDLPYSVQSAAYHPT